MRPGGVDGLNRCRRPEEGDEHGVFVRLVCNPALALEYAQDVALGRDEELADLLLTGACLRKCEVVALQNALSLPALHVPVARAVLAARDKRRAVVSELHLRHGATDIQTFEIGMFRCQKSQILQVFEIGVFMCQKSQILQVFFLKTCKITGGQQLRILLGNY